MEIAEAIVQDWKEVVPAERRPHIVAVPEVQRLKVVCIGGGTGLPRVLRGLADQSWDALSGPLLDITAVVAMSDDGGSSGHLRRTRGLLPPGDVRNCLAALSMEEGPLSELFQHRFAGNGLSGHALGNLLIAALTEQRGDFLEAVQILGNMLHTCGRVLPSTLAEVELVAQLDDDRRIVGESNLAKARGHVRRVSLSPRLPPPAEGILEAIAEAELITLGPGSLFSSVLPNLLVDGVADALRRSRALKVMVANLMTQPGETDAMTGVEHLDALHAHAGHVVDVVLTHRMALPEAAVERYRRKGSVPVVWDRDALIDRGVVPIEVDLLEEGTFIRHDRQKLANSLIELAQRGL